jgi:hypothetical protein
MFNFPYRKEFFKSICMEDVREIIKFEVIIRNYMKMDMLSKELKNEKQ